MGKEGSSTLKNKLDKVNKGQVGINNEAARVELAKQKYLDELGLKGEERRQVASALTKEMVIDQYDSIDKYDPALLARSKDLTIQQMNRNSIEKNIKQQARAWDGAWTSLYLLDKKRGDFVLNEKQGKGEMRTGVALRKINREEAEACAG